MGILRMNPCGLLTVTGILILTVVGFGVSEDPGLTDYCPAQTPAGQCPNDVNSIGEFCEDDDWDCLWKNKPGTGPMIGEIIDDDWDWGEETLKGFDKELYENFQKHFYPIKKGPLPK